MYSINCLLAAVGTVVNTVGI